MPTFQKVPILHMYHPRKHNYSHLNSIKNHTKIKVSESFFAIQEAQIGTFHLEAA